MMDTALYALGGVVVATTYSLINKTYENRVGAALTSVDLNVLPSFDRTLMGDLVLLENIVFKHDPVAFVRLCDAADDLVTVRKTLELNVEDATLTTRVDAFNLFKQCELCLKRILNTLNAILTPKDIVDIQNIMLRIVESLECHLATINVILQNM